MSEESIIYRIAKITPKKVGQFVIFWKRPASKTGPYGPTMPYEDCDPFDVLIVNVLTATRSGYFEFPKSILVEKGIVAKNGTGGKRAFRVYPPWDKAINSQAKKTQSWQVCFFTEKTSLQNQAVHTDTDSP